MPIIATDKGSNFKPVPEGSHIARCIGVYDLGTQDSPQYGMSRKVLLTFEVPEQTIGSGDEEKPMMLSRTYTLSTNAKSDLRKHLESWRGKTFSQQEVESFDVSRLLGKPCMISVIHKEVGEKTFANIVGITPMHKSLVCPEAYHDAVLYEIEMGRGGTFDRLPEWVQNKVNDALELNPVAGAKPAAVAAQPVPVEDDLPF